MKGVAFLKERSGRYMEALNLYFDVMLYCIILIDYQCWIKKDVSNWIRLVKLNWADININFTLSKNL